MPSGRSASQKMVPRAESSMMCPRGAVSVAGVIIDVGPSVGSADSGTARGLVVTFVLSIGDFIFA